MYAVNESSCAMTCNLQPVLQARMLQQQSCHTNTISQENSTNMKFLAGTIIYQCVFCSGKSCDICREDDGTSYWCSPIIFLHTVYIYDSYDSNNWLTIISNLSYRSFNPICNWFSAQHPKDLRTFLRFSLSRSPLCRFR